MIDFRSKIQRQWSIALCSLFAIVLIGYLKNSLELEDAEQAYYSQWWRLGYDDQPPLYTWLQKLINQVFGVTKFSFSVLRGSLFASTLVLLFKLGKKIFDDNRRAQHVLLAAILVPVFMDFAFRRLSHTLLACVVVLATYLVMVHLVKKRSIKNYFLLGIGMGVGMLAKYNYVLFPLALLVTSWFNTNIKSIVWNKRIVLSLVVALLLFLPHLYWLLYGGYFYEIRNSLDTKFGEVKSGTVIIMPILNTLKAFLEGMLPVLLAVSALFLFRKKKVKLAEKFKWLLHLGLVQVLVIVVLFVVMNSQEVHGRWLLPLLLPYLVLFIALLEPIKTGYIKWGTMGLVSILCFQVVRTPLEKLLGIPSDIHFEYTELRQKLKKEFDAETWVLPNVTYGGQIRFLDEERALYTLDDFSLTLPKHTAEGFVVVAHQNMLRTQKPVDSLITYGPNGENLYFFKIKTPSEIPLQ